MSTSGSSRCRLSGLVTAPILSGLHQGYLSLLLQPCRHGVVERNECRIPHDLGEGKVGRDIGLDEGVRVSDRIAVGVERPLQSGQIFIGRVASGRGTLFQNGFRDHTNVFE
jgi:hypothetical protein